MGGDGQVLISCEFIFPEVVSSWAGHFVRSRVERNILFCRVFHNHLAG